MLLALVSTALTVEARKFDFEPSVTASAGSDDLVWSGQNLEVELWNGPRDKACEVCGKLVDQVSALLDDPSFKTQAISMAESIVCLQLPPDLVEKCVVTVEEYVEEAISTLQNVISKDQLCIQTKICEALPNGQDAKQMVNNALLESTPQCDVCRQVVFQVQLLLDNGKTQQQIIDALHTQCKRFSKTTEKCTQLVDEYVPQILVLIQTLSPNEICKALKLCEPVASLLLLPSEETNGRQLREQTLSVSHASDSLMSNTQECAACRFLVAQAKKKLSDPSNQVKLTIILVEACDKLDDFKVQCKAAVMQYLPQLFDNVDVLDPATFCSTVKLCA